MKAVVKQHLLMPMETFNHMPVLHLPGAACMICSVACTFFVAEGMVGMPLHVTGML